MTIVPDAWADQIVAWRDREGPATRLLPDAIGQTGPVTFAVVNDCNELSPAMAEAASLVIERYRGALDLLAER